MDRINVYHTYGGKIAADDDPAFFAEESPTVLGWFDYDKAETFREDTETNGSNFISVQTGSEWDHETLLRTSGGKWVLRTHSQRQGVMDCYYYMTDDQAREWLIRNGSDAAVARLFGELPGEEDRRTGRPEVGGLIQVRLGNLLPQVDHYVAETGASSRAEAVRKLVAEALFLDRPYTVTHLDLSTRVREMVPEGRYATLGAAVARLRREQADDAENNGLPSYEPRVEHDGRPVDVEAVQA